jgi:hypothetical protein
MKLDNIYRRIRLLIKATEDKRKTVIKSKDIVDSIANTIDLSNVSREELEERLIKAEVAVCLYQCGYRSVIRGHGYFVNWAKLDRPEYLENLVENAKASKNEKRKIYKELVRKTVDDFPDYAQMYMDMSGEDVIFKEHLTKKDILSMLEEDAEAV